MEVITAVNEANSIKSNNNPKIFLAGGISNCPDWQSEAINYFSQINNYDFTLYNPRRPDFPINDPSASEHQIVWEYNHLKESDMIIYWFAKGSLNPIVLYELGKWGNSSNKLIYIGIDPEYQRKQDVIIQTALARPEVTIYNSLEKLCNAVMRDLMR